MHDEINQKISSLGFFTRPSAKMFRSMRTEGI